MLHAPKLTQIFVVRHAEVHNPQDILYGRLPGFRLSERGKEQARMTARFLAGRALTTIYTSPLLRARQTAEVLAAATTHTDGLRSKDLIEVKTGHEGRPNSIIKPGFSFYDPLADPGDETMQHVFSRVHAFLKRIIRRHPGEAVAAVSHADPITIMRVGLAGQELTPSNMHATVYPARASVTLVTVSEQPPRLTYFDVAEAAE